MRATPSATETDQGLQFGTWSDNTSRLIYADSMNTLLNGTDVHDRVLDLGGGNGLMRGWFDQVTTVDTDTAKEPDIVADLRSWEPSDTRAYDLVLFRYVLHYLTDSELVELFTYHLTEWWSGPVLVIQFVAPDAEALRLKESNSVNEVKRFRTERQLAALLTVSGRWDITRRIAVEYDVDPEFYVNRLGATDPTGHPERVVAYTLHPTNQ